jgi:2',3'-cyclic-nucleotide 2'-phosphodiesterase (5'-nucleotidase family)
MRLRRRFAAVTVALTLALGSVGMSATAEAHRRPPKPKDVQLQTLSFNDFHGHLEPPGGTDEPLGTDARLGKTLDPTETPVGGAEYLASTLDGLRAKAKYSQTVTAGDLIGGSPFLSGLFHDEPAVESLNAMGLDVSSVGNHEFDEGVTELQRMQRGGCHPEDGCYEPWGAGGYPGADFPWLAANVVRERTGRAVLPGTWVTKVNGVKVGYIGMTLKDTPTLVAQSGIKGIEFRDEVQTANRAARDLRRSGVETIIVLVHEGGLQTGTYQQCNGISGPIVKIAEDLSPSIDLVVTGHEHLYQRTRPLAPGPECDAVRPGRFDPGCVATTSRGTTFVTVGTGGHELRSVNRLDPEGRWFVASSGRNVQPSFGSLDVTVTAGRLTASFVPVGGGSFTDRLVLTR